MAQNFFVSWTLVEVSSCSYHSNMYDLFVYIIYILIYIYNRQCEYLPQKIKDEYIQLKYHTKLVRGKKKYWVTSAEKRGLMDDPDVDGIVFSANFKKNM